MASAWAEGIWKQYESKHYSFEPFTSGFLLDNIKTQTAMYLVILYKQQGDNIHHYCPDTRPPMYRLHHCLGNLEMDKLDKHSQRANALEFPLQTLNNTTSLMYYYYHTNKNHLYSLWNMYQRKASKLYPEQNSRLE